MGMDVYGKEPKSERGSYFRNNLWYWRPLWSYCISRHPDLAEKVEGAFFNDGDGLDAEDSVALAERLTQDLALGIVEDYKREYDAAVAALPMVDCDLCATTGIRTDEIGVSMGMPTQELSQEEAIILGRTHGTCNGCRGMGVRPSFGTHYPFEVDNVREFAEFLADCGGFEIW